MTDNADASRTQYALAILNKDGTLNCRKDPDGLFNERSPTALLSDQYSDNVQGFFEFMRDTRVHHWKQGRATDGELAIKAVSLDSESVMLVAEPSDATTFNVRTIEAAFYQAIEQSGHGVLVTDPNGTILYANPQIEENTGYDRSEIIGETPAMFQSGQHDEAFYKNLWETIKNGNVWEDELINKHKNDELYVVNQTIAPITDPDGAILGYIAVNKEITEQWSQRKQLQEQARKDPTLEIATHDFMIEQIDEIKSRNEENKGLLALISLDNHESLKKSIGPRAINLIMETLLEQAQGFSHSEDLLSKLNDGEILLFSDRFAAQNEARAFIEKLSDTIRSTFHHNDLTYDLDVSIGSTFRPLSKANPNQLIDEVDKARLAARQSSGERFQMYHPDHENIRTQALESMRLSRHLKKGLDRGEFLSHYQPIIDMDRRTITGFEALLRWDHPEKGTLTPAEFISQAREDGLLKPIEKQIMSRSFDFIGELNDEFDRSFDLNLNVEPGQFNDPNFPDKLDGVLGRSSLEAESVHVEIVESEQLRNKEALKQLNRVKDLGFKLSVDDFGTGFSSLDYLIKIPADTVKVDRGLVKELDQDNPSDPVLFAVVSMIRNLGKNIIAEGIETEFQHRTLKGMNVDFTQGYLYSKPLPPGGMPGVY